MPRIERSYFGVHRAIDALDELAYAQRQRLTVPLARRALGLIDEPSTAGVIDESQNEA